MNIQKQNTELNVSQMIEKLNYFFNTTVPNLYNKYKDPYSRTRKLTINDVLEYAINYAHINNTKLEASEKVGLKVSRIAYDAKFKSIPTNFFIYLNNEISKLYDDISKDSKIIEINGKLGNKLSDIYFNDDELFTILSADGCCGNIIQNGELYTDSVLHVIKNNNKIPIATINHQEKNISFDLNKNCSSNKNNEIALLEHFLNNNTTNCNLESSVFLLDRAYASYKLIKIMLEKKIKFVIRLKENFNILNKNKKKPSPNDKIINLIENHQNVEIIENVINSKHKYVISTNKTIEKDLQSKYYLISNLKGYKGYSKETIIELYRRRWDIETHFKSLKNNLKYSCYNLKEYGEIEKLRHINSFVSILSKLILNISLKNSFEYDMKKISNIVKKRFNPNEWDKRTREYKRRLKDFLDNPTYEVIVTINYNKFIKDFYNLCLSPLCKGKIDIETINRIVLNVQKDKTKRSYERKSIQPYSKWYVKMYSNRSKYNRIFDALENNNIMDLDKNLKSEASMIIKRVQDFTDNLNYLKTITV